MKIQIPALDLWDYLGKTDKTIVLYGMGNGADKILAVCNTRGIPVADIFASDGFVRGQFFHGKTVLSYSAVKEKYGKENLIVLLSFATSRPEVLDIIHAVASECELYAPDVPAFGDTLFDLDFYLQNEEKFEEAYSLLCDEESKEIYEQIILYKLTDKLCHLEAAESDKDTVMRSLLGAQSIRSYLDLGAYNGDTIRELLNYAPSLERVFAMEPDRRSFRKLTEYAQAVGERPLITATQAAAWSEDTTLHFGDEGNRNSSLSATGHATKETLVRALSADSLLDGESVDYIKYDVEGAEREALIGTQKTIAAHRPRLLISCYHRSEDLFALPLQMARMRPDYRLFLRRYPYIPAWDLNLICL